MEEQHSLEWYRKRLGNFTGSRVGDLMKTSRKTGEMFGDTAKSYIYQVAAERNMNQSVVEDDELFQMYLNQVEIGSKAMRWGNEQEGNARSLYEKITGRRIVETGSCAHPSIPHFASSPDGYYYDEDTHEKGCIEIKSPSQYVFMMFCGEITGNDSLKKVRPEYYYQCMAHMMCLEADWCDFVAFNPFQKHPIHIVRILPEPDVFTEMEKRIRTANDIVEQLID